MNSGTLGRNMAGGGVGERGVDKRGRGWGRQEEKINLLAIMVGRDCGGYGGRAGCGVGMKGFNVDGTTRCYRAA